MLYPDKYKDLDYCRTMNYYRAENGLPEDVVTRFYDTLIDHITCVQEAGEKLGLPEYQLAVHDITKFTGTEFFAYAKHFQGGGAPDEFALAWLHHLHFNAHHPEHWQFPREPGIKNANIVCRCLPMPHRFVLEHIADLMGASKAYTGSDDMSDWLSKNMGKMYYHPDTAKVLREELSKIGYTDIVSNQRFGHENATAN